MADKIIYLAEARNGPLAIPDRLESPSGNVADRLGRPLHDLRISITDRCNFRCVYCMPKDVFDKNHVYLPHTDLLSFEEITRVARLFVAPGVEKTRPGGGGAAAAQEYRKAHRHAGGPAHAVGPAAGP